MVIYKIHYLLSLYTAPVLLVAFLSQQEEIVHAIQRPRWVIKYDMGNKGGIIQVK